MGGWSIALDANVWVACAGSKAWAKVGEAAQVVQFARQVRSVSCASGIRSAIQSDDGSTGLQSNYAVATLDECRPWLVCMLH